MSFWSKKKPARTPQELKSVATAMAAELVNEGFPESGNYFKTVYADSPQLLAEGLAALQLEELYFLLYLLFRAAREKLGPDAGADFMQFLFEQTCGRWSRIQATSPDEAVAFSQLFEMGCSERQRQYARCRLPSGTDLKDSVFWEYAKTLTSRVKDPNPERVGRLALHGSHMFDFAMKALDKALGGA